MGEGKSIQQRDAEQIIRLFNVVFNGAMLYGGSHPTTLKSIPPLHDALVRSLEKIETISLVIDRESLLIEEWPVDRVINTRRIIQQFGKSGIVSITFDRNISIGEIETLIRLIGNPDSVSPVETIEKILEQEGTASVRLNYIHYGRITDDQEVVGKQENVRCGNEKEDVNTIVGRVHLERVEEVLSMADLFEHPERTAAAFSKEALDPEKSDSAVRSLSDLRRSIHLEGAPSVDMLLNAVFELKADLAEAISVQKETGKLLAVSDPVANEMNGLTCDVIVKLVREEYGSGGVPLRRLAEIIRRMLPEKDELKQLLPKLKPALLESGMPLSDYLQLIRTLNIDFRSESLADTLQDAASGIGASVDDLVKAIQSQPDEAARLLVMASEIRKGTLTDDAQLSNMLTEYIEKVSTSLALNSHDLGCETGGNALREILSRLEGQLLDNLKKYGLDNPVLDRVGTLLRERFETVHDHATAQWITSEIAEKPHLSGRELSEQLVRMVSEQSQLERLRDPVMSALSLRGFDKGQTEEFFKRIAARIASGKMMKLPPGVLSATNMKFLLDREIRQHNRYRTPFSSIMLTAEAFVFGGGARRTTEGEMWTLAPRLFSVAKLILRDIDLVGGLPEPYERAVFSLLAMTDGKGALVARTRILKKLGEMKVATKEGEATVIVAASVTAPEEEREYDMKSYLELVYRTHHETIENAFRQYGIHEK